MVEDNVDFKFYLTSLLENEFELYTAKNGRDALNILGYSNGQEKSNIEYRKFDLIITDLMMPLMNGYELIESLKSLDNLADIPVIVLTAKSDAESIDKAIRFGIDSFMIKPFNQKQLLANMSVLIERYRVRIQSKLELEESISTLTNEVGVKEEQMHEWFAHFKNCVQENIDSPDLTIDDIARSMYISKRQLHRKMKLTFGMTPNQCIREMRLERARELLITGQCKSVKEVSLSVGFKKITYFSSLFLERYGERPSSYLEKKH